MTADSAIRVSVPSDAACMTVVRAMVEKTAVLAGFNGEEVGHIVLAVDEACTNIIRHQYGGRADGRIDMEVRIDDSGGGLDVVLRDYGPTRDAGLFRGRPLEEVRPGGLGLHIIRRIMDRVEYAAAPGGGMELRLSKSARRSPDRGDHGSKPEQ